jgi:hypothetical protein
MNIITTHNLEWAGEFFLQVQVKVQPPLTKIICTHVAVKPPQSVAVQVRLMVNSAGHVPATVTSLKVNTGILQLSVPVGSPVLAGKVPSAESTVILGGQVIIGAWLSSMVMI